MKTAYLTLASCLLAAIVAPSAAAVGDTCPNDEINSREPLPRCGDPADSAECYLRERFGVAVSDGAPDCG